MENFKGKRKNQQEFLKNWGKKWGEKGKFFKIYEKNSQ